ncbi:MAG TPA: hypothetical protein VHA09_03670 [Nitrososphaera sp.]|nr:hypothetical protein [Nitrososphaera sp.]
MSGILLVVIIPAIIAFLFSMLVAYYAFADVSERQLPSGEPNVHRLKIEMPGQP